MAGMPPTQTMAPSNAPRAARLKTDLKQATAETQSHRSRIAELREELAQAKKDREEAAEQFRVCSLKVSKLTNEYGVVSDALGTAQGKMSMIQGELSRAEGSRVG